MSLSTDPYIPLKLHVDALVLAHYDNGEYYAARIVQVEQSGTNVLYSINQIF